MRQFPDPSILLHPQIPKPLHLLNPRTILGDEWWNKCRQEAYARHKYCCYACGTHKLIAKYHNWLEAHEFYSINYKTGEVKFIELVALCHSCHNYIHKGRMTMVVGTDDMPEEKYLDILTHGDKILRDNKLKTKIPKVKCEWKDWHLIIEDKNYGQRFHSYEEWSTYWRNKP